LSREGEASLRKIRREEGVRPGRTSVAKPAAERASMSWVKVASASADSVVGRGS
jgi:hypothetical protein